MRILILIIFAICIAGTCVSCASVKVPPIYENESCKVIVTPGKIKIQLKTDHGPAVRKRTTFLN